MTDNEDNTNIQKKKIYKTPVLSLYGSIKELTKGGAGSKPEGGSKGSMKHP